MMHGVPTPTLTWATTATKQGLAAALRNNHEFDVGLVFHDRQFDPQGVDFFPHACFDGAIGDKMTVNGKIQPFMPVKQRKYRFRMLNMGRRASTSGSSATARPSSSSPTTAICCRRRSW